ncbi:ABC transporter ATP-binding protein [Candidatus Uabimicrobium amorphum]|uniref:Sugar ABC transporter ATP-binding protein n=1 Tax=Uabimicrobium amorphum TaxID=2596890 RepID=A0A5S9IT48_UABAM|nr:ABC transporter ATP-binding protein [Candidatus Uabimicrobium amorphum]BBM87673.1 sugar ABC transporter ATP-binding protein [Candidatus Uabimicrobium amorphum]
MSLELKNISKTFASKKVLNNISLSVSEGEILMLLGPSAAGKTTLLHIIAGLQNVDCGSVIFQSKDMAHVPVHQRNIGLLFQESTLLPHLTVEENLRFVCRAKKYSPQKQNAEIVKVIKDLRLENLRYRYPQNLSGGEVQRAALGRVLIRKPSLMLLDEPFAHLDVKTQYALRSKVKQICRDLKIPVVYVTHNQQEALAMGDKLAILLSGQLQQLDTPHNVYNFPKTLEVASFLGDPPMNIINAQVENSLLKIDNQQTAIPTNLTNGQITLAIRAQHITLEHQGVLGIVDDIEFHGLGFLFYVRTQAQRLMVFCHEKIAEKGDEVFMNFAVDKVIIF